MSGGRPSKYDPAFCAKVIELGEQGASIVEMAYECGVCRNTLTAWTEEHEEFLKAFTRAQLASQVWWERKGRTGMEKSSQEFQASIWSRSMAARFPQDWREKQMIGSDPENPLPAPVALDASKLSTDALKELMAARNNNGGK